MQAEEELKKERKEKRPWMEYKEGEMGENGGTEKWLGELGSGRAF